MIWIAMLQGSYFDTRKPTLFIVSLSKFNITMSYIIPFLSIAYEASNFLK